MEPAVPTNNGGVKPKPMAFPMPPKSALFSKLESFLPLMAQENEKLEAAIAAGDGDRLNIELPVADDADAGADQRDDRGASDDDDDEDDDGDVDMDASVGVAGPAAPIIEMNFALGLMEDGALASDSDSDSDEDEVDLAASVEALRQQQQQPTARDDDDASRTLLLTKPTAEAPKKPMIVELD